MSEHKAAKSGQAQSVMLGIIVKTTKVGESDLRLTLFTESGIKYLTVKGVLKLRAKFGSSVALFTIAEFTVNKNTISGINVLVSPFTIPREINRYYVASAIADSLQKMEFVENTPEVLILAVNALTSLAAAAGSCYPIFIEYFGSLFELLGYSVPLDYTKDEKLTLEKAKKLVSQIAEAYLLNMDYKITMLDGFI
jgi:recombinational DNA repair protein (RecF pathway)